MREPAPGDREGWTVFADWLRSQGDDRRVDVAVWAHRRPLHPSCPVDDDEADWHPIHTLYPRRCPTCFPTAEHTAWLAGASGLLIEGATWKGHGGRAILQAIDRRAYQECGRRLRIEPTSSRVVNVPRSMFRPFSVHAIGRADSQDERGLTWLHSRLPEIADALGMRVYIEERLDDVRLHLEDGS